MKEKNILKLKDCVSELGNKYYNKKPVPYQCKKIQNAYMFRYFPYYIETIYYILKNFNVSCTSKIFEGKFKVSIYGCGPAPELLGLCAYLRDYSPSTRTISVSFFDENNWDTWRSFTINELKPSVWDGTIESQFYNLNFIAMNDATTKTIASQIAESQIHCLQNVISDLFYRYREKSPGDNDFSINKKIADIITNLVGLSSQGSLWIISDQYLPEVQKILQSISYEVKRNKIGEIIIPSDQRHIYSPELSNQELISALRQDKKEVGFWKLVIRRI
jgi:hypothetical protein